MGSTKLIENCCGTATNGVDYEVLPGYVTLAAGAATADITVTPIPDSAAMLEENETVILQIVAPAGRRAPYDVSGSLSGSGGKARPVPAFSRTLLAPLH